MSAYPGRCAWARVARDNQSGLALLSASRMAMRAPPRRELGDRAAAGLLRHPLDDPALHLRGHLGIAEIVPPALHGHEQMLHEMLHAADAAGEMEGEMRPVDRPA